MHTRSGRMRISDHMAFGESFHYLVSIPRLKKKISIEYIYLLCLDASSFHA